MKIEAGNVYANFLVLKTNNARLTRDIKAQCKCLNCGAERSATYTTLHERMKKGAKYCKECKPGGAQIRKRVKQPEPNVWDKAVYAWNHKWPWLGVIR
jgi:transcription elongation factor Elf1